MTADLDTVLVVSTDVASQGPFVVMNRVDFNPEIHTLYEEDKPRRGRKPKTEMKEPENGNG